MLFATSVLVLSVLLASVLAIPSHSRAGSIARAAHRHTGGRTQSFHRRETAISPTEYAPSWAGCVHDVATPGTFTSITGTFTVPKVWGINNAVGTAWIGIDGHANCESGQGLLQTGVDFNVVGDQVQYHTWGEWYPDWTRPFDTPIDIARGDDIRLTIKVYSATSGLVMIENLTTGQMGSMNLTSTYELCQQSAEWIVEDYDGETVPLVDFSPITFTDAEAKGGNQTYTPLGSTIIDMEQNSQVLTSVTTSNSNVTIRRLEI